MNQRHVCLLLLGCCVATFAPSQTVGATDDWPRWNGPHHEMISGESGWAKDWTAQPPVHTWTTEVGIGFSSVSVVGDRVFTMGREGENDIVYSLNAETGETNWRYTYVCKQLANMHEGGPGSTPTVDGDHVYTFSREGHVHCLNAADGSVVWSTFLPDLTGINHPVWGFTASPLVLGDLVIFESGSVVALNKLDGQLVWKTPDHPPGYGSVMTFENEGKSWLATLNNDGLLIVDPHDGSEVAEAKWRTNWETNSTTPIYFDGKFFLSTGYRHGCGLFEWSMGELTEVYANKSLANHMNNSVYWEGHIYGIHGNSTDGRRCQLICINAADGTVQWGKQGLGCGSLLISDGYIIALSDSGVLTCGEARPDDFEPTGRVQAVKGRCWTVPVLANGRVYCRSSRGSLACWQLAREGDTPNTAANVK